MSLEDDIKARAIELGFDAVGITDASPLEAGHVRHFKAWLEARCHAQMAYMARNLQTRADPSRLLPGAESVVSLALGYKPPARNDGAAPPGKPVGRVADYACYEDYHRLIKGLLHDLAEYIRSVTGPDTRFRNCVDSAPVAERALAQRAGLGFVGRNHMLINPKLGPQIFLAELITTLKLEPDRPAGTGCAGCERCLDACPTGALRADGLFEAGRCISYLTIEHKGPIPPELAAKIGDRLFGCDQCVLACPHSQQAPEPGNKPVRFYPERRWLDLRRLLAISAESFEREFAGSPLIRAGPAVLKRNAEICLANSAG